MHGPGIAWYVVLAGLLFATGALGVLLRRSPLIILLSVEIMLNSAQPAPDRVLAPARPRGRPDLRDLGDGGRRLRGRRRARADRRHGPPRRRARRRQAPDAARMIVAAAAWVCLLLPLASAVAITLAGHALSRRARGLPRDRDDVRRVRRRASSTSCKLHDLARGSRSHATTSWTWLSAGPVPLRPLAARRPAQRDDDADRRRRRRPDRRLLGRLHGGRGRGAPLLRLHVAVRLLDAAARAGRQPAAAARRLGHGRPLELPADRLLPVQGIGGRGRQEGVRDERVRRRDDGARALPADPAHRPARLRRRVRRLAARRRGREPDRARPARRRGREVRADPAPHLASRRDGGPDAGQRPHPRGHDGHGRRLPDRAHATRCSRRPT